MGLARTSAMPMAMAGCPSDDNPKRLIQKPIGLAWLYNWSLAGPLYAEAEKLFEQARDRCIASASRRPDTLRPLSLLPVSPKISRNLIPYYKIESNVRFRGRDIAEWLQQRAA